MQSWASKQSIKFSTKWRLTFETNMQKLFESKTNQAADGLPNTVDAKIIIDSTPYLLYYQFDFMMFIECISNQLWYLKIC